MVYQAVVVDNGTSFVKCGFARDCRPCTFPSVVGRPLHNHENEFKYDMKNVMVGDECHVYRDKLSTSCPLSQGIVRDWDDMRYIWNYTWQQLKIQPNNHRILLTETPNNTMQNKIQMYENMFELYGFQGVKVQLQDPLVLYAQGLVTGIVVDSGETLTRITAIHDNIVDVNSIKHLHVAGTHITSYLMKLLQSKSYQFNHISAYDTVRKIKEQYCYVGYDIDLEDRLARETTTLIQTYRLPDGKKIKIGEERYQAPEVLFYPYLVDIDNPGIHQLLFDLIQQQHDTTLQSTFYQHIVLSGGSTMYAGLPSRLEKEIKELYLTRVLKGNEKGLDKFKLRIEDPPNRHHMVYLGGSVLADIMKGEEANEFWISK